MAAWHLPTEKLLARRWPSCEVEEQRVLTEGGAILFPEIGSGPAGGRRLAAHWRREYESARVPLVAFAGVSAMLLSGSVSLARWWVS